MKRHVPLRDTTAYRRAIRDYEPAVLARCEEARQRIMHHKRFDLAGDEPLALVGHVVAFTQCIGTISHPHQTCELYWHDRVVDEDTAKRKRAR